jgi:Ankyrin repeats (3 copies)/Ankyrin repeats (many copies)
LSVVVNVKMDSQIIHSRICVLSDILSPDDFERRFDALPDATATTLGENTDNKKLNVVFMLLTAFRELSGTLSAHAYMIVQTIIALLDDIKSPTFELGFVYHLLGRVLIETRSDVTNGTICFDKAFALLVNNLRKVLDEDSTRTVAVLDAIQLMMDRVNINAARVAIKKMVGNPLFVYIGRFGDAHLNLAKFCLQVGANVDDTNSDGVTALYCASNNGHIGMVEFLVKCGANVHTTSSKGMTVLHCACSKGNFQIVQYLVKNGSSLEASNGVGYTALHYACTGGYPAIVRYLVEQGSSLETRDDVGDNALHFACRKGDLETIKH